MQSLPFSHELVKTNGRRDRDYERCLPQIKLEEKTKQTSNGCEPNN